LQQKFLWNIVLAQFILIFHDYHNYIFFMNVQTVACFCSHSHFAEHFIYTWHV